VSREPGAARAGTVSASRRLGYPAVGRAPVGSSLYHGTVNKTRSRPTARAGLPAAAAALLLLLASCAPAAQAPLPAAASRLDTTARIVYHRMAIGFLETGAYTTNVLVDVQLPAGARWTLEAYPRDGSSYRLRITSTQVPGIAWEVSPGGVRRVPVPR